MFDKEIKKCPYCDTEIEQSPNRFDEDNTVVCQCIINEITMKIDELYEERFYKIDCNFDLILEDVNAILRKKDETYYLLLKKYDILLQETKKLAEEFIKQQDRLDNFKHYMEAIKNNTENIIIDKVKAYLGVKKWLIDLDKKAEKENEEQNV